MSDQTEQEAQLVCPGCESETLCWTEKTEHVGTVHINSSGNPEAHAKQSVPYSTDLNDLICQNCQSSFDVSSLKQIPQPR